VCDLTGGRSLLSRLISNMELSTDDVAVEAWFKPGSFQRRMIDWAATNNDWKLHYINIKTPIAVRFRLDAFV
jgi:hypothetical protein